MRPIVVRWRPPSEEELERRWGQIVAEAAEELRRMGAVLIEDRSTVCDFRCDSLRGPGACILVATPQRVASLAESGAVQRALATGLEVAVLVVGFWSRMDPGSWVRLLEALQSLGVAVVPAVNRKWVAAYVAARARLAIEPPQSRVPRGRPPVPRSAPLHEKQLYFLEAIAGSRTAEALLRRFGSIERVAKASIEELAETIVGGKRLGYRRAESIWRAFREHPPLDEE